MNAEQFKEEARQLQEIKDDVRLRYPDVEWPDVYSTGSFIGDHRDNIERLQDQVAIVGSFQEDRSDRNFYCHASEQYKIAPFEVCVHNLETALMEAELKEFGHADIQIKTMECGAVMKATVKFPDIDFTVRDGDTVKPQAEMYASHDKSKSVASAFGAEQLICTNGLVAFVLQKKISQKHRQNLDVPSITAQLMVGLTEFSEQIGLWKRWAEKELNASEWDTLQEALPFGKEYAEKVLTLPQTSTGNTIRGLLEKNNKINMWDAHSIVTQFVTHEVTADRAQFKYGNEVAAAFHNIALN